MTGVIVDLGRCAVCDAKFQVGEYVDLVEGEGNVCHNGYCISLLAFRTGKLLIANTHQYGRKRLLGPKDWPAIGTLAVLLVAVLAFIAWRLVWRNG